MNMGLIEREYGDAMEGGRDVDLEEEGEVHGGGESESEWAGEQKGKETQWQRFAHEVRRLNRESGRGVQYKVLYLGRHGEGYHNVAEAYYGTPAWDVCSSPSPCFPSFSSFLSSSSSTYPHNQQQVGQAS